MGNDCKWHRRRGIEFCYPDTHILKCLLLCRHGFVHINSILWSASCVSGFWHMLWHTLLYLILPTMCEMSVWIIPLLQTKKLRWERLCSLPTGRTWSWNWSQAVWLQSCVLKQCIRAENGQVWNAIQLLSGSLIPISLRLSSSLPWALKDYLGSGVLCLYLFCSSATSWVMSFPTPSLFCHLFFPESLETCLKRQNPRSQMDLLF